MSSDARILDKLLDDLTGFDFSEINRYGDDVVSQGIIGVRIGQQISSISFQINSVIQNITKSNFIGFTRDDLVRYKQKLSLIKHILDYPELYPDFEKYIDVGLENERRADDRNFWYSEEKLRIFIEQLEKHLGSVARSQRPLSSPLLDEVLEEIERGNRLDIVVDRQPLSLSGNDLTEFLGDQKERFTCPISYEVMKDPVICSDGHSYERSAIQEWFDRGNNTSPKTNVRLSNRNLIPNIALRQAIEAYNKLLEAKKAGAGYKRRKTKTGRKRSKYTRRSKKT
uniref:U-box domain-containing protein n=1 Tax=viral metagenome TaxID=1070528 RepID=A0A6C0E6Q6_9ZZZZ